MSLMKTIARLAKMSLFKYLLKQLVDMDSKPSSRKLEKKKIHLSTRRVGVKYQGEQKQYQINQYGEVRESGS
jgi:hypothetical protein